MRAPRAVRGNPSDRLGASEVPLGTSTWRAGGGLGKRVGRLAARDVIALRQYHENHWFSLGFFNTLYIRSGVSGHALAVSNCNNHWFSLGFSLILLRGLQNQLYFLGFGAVGGAPPPRRFPWRPRKQTCSSELLIFLEDFDDFHVP